jgi:tripartite ATP-independent transporter DctP family solute receptor
MKLNGLFLASLIGAATLLPGLASAQISEHKFRLGVQVNLDTERGKALQVFANAVQAKSGGKMTVQIFPGGALGGDLPVISALRGGTIDATATATSTLVGVVKEFALLDLPFIFQNDAEAMAVLDGPFGQRMNKLLDEKGLVALGYWGSGFRHLTNSRHPVTKVEDVKGLKIRVLQNPVYIDLWNTLGANAVPMPFPEVYSALEQKTVDGQENPAATLVSAKLNEVQKYLSLTSHIYFLDSVLFSKPVFDKLTADEKKVIKDAAAEMQAYGRKAVPGEDGKIIEDMKKVMTVNEIAPAEMARFRAAAKPVVDKAAAAADPALAKEMFDAIAKVRGSK